MHVKIETRRYTSKQMQSAKYMHTHVRLMVRALPRIRVSWVEITPEAVNFSLSDLGELCCVALSFCCVVLPCLVFPWKIYVHDIYKKAITELLQILMCMDCI